MKKIIQWLRDMKEENTREAKRIAEHKATLDMTGMYRGAAIIVCWSSVIICICLYVSEYSNPLTPSKRDLRQLMEMLDKEAVIDGTILTDAGASEKEKR